VDSIREARRLSGRVPDSDPGLADSGWSKQRQQPGVIAFDEFGHVAEFFVTAHRIVGEHRKRRSRGLVQVGRGKQRGAVGFGETQSLSQQPHSGQPW
jgi:hypothetical protein